MVRAWRYWRVSPTGRLRAVSHRVEWPTDGPLRARCLHGGHEAPASGCACGVYGTSSLELLRSHGLCVGTGPVAVGEVELSGALVTDDDGMRAAAGVPVRIWLVSETAGGRQAELLAGLAAYGVSVSTMAAADATDGATAAMMAFQAMSAPRP